MVSRLKVSDTKDFFTRNEKPFFWLGDTLWCGFSRTSISEWKHILRKRKQQGFNVAQIMVLPAWDQSVSRDPSAERRPLPFIKKDDGSYDFDRVNPEYFEDARQKLEMAAALGFVPVLVPVWVHYVENTWCSRNKPGTVMKQAQIEKYLEYIVPLFKPYAPVYLCSGDSAYESAEEIALYRSVMAAVRRLDPEALLSLHPNPHNYPEELIKDPNLDFYLYQAGHVKAEQDNCRTMAEFYLGQKIKRPIVNGEPCYECHGHGRKYGRHDAFDVRRAVWTSLLSGAKAGVTYGAHGLWNMQGWDDEFPEDVQEWSMMTPVWSRALNMPGADDMGWTSYLYKNYRMNLAEPARILAEPNTDISAAAHPDRSKVFIYMPYVNYLKIKPEYASYRCTAFALEQRTVISAAITEHKDFALIEFPQQNSDILFVLEKD